MVLADTYSYLVETIARSMREMSSTEARALASDITTLVNASLSKVIGTQHNLELAGGMVPEVVRNSSTLSVGWDAYRQVHESQSGGLIRAVPVTVLCTLPPSFRNTSLVRCMAVQTGIWAGTLMTEMYELIQTANQEVVIVAPYWSPQGVAGLLRHVTRSDMHGVKVYIITQPAKDLKKEGLDAIQLLRQGLAIKSANVTILSPKREDGKTPLIHAKTVIRDGIEVYLGSANYSANGVEQSFELGVRLQGPAAQGVRDWVGVLMDSFEAW